MATQKVIAFSESAKAAIERLRDLKSGVPTESDMTLTSGEGDGPAYQYHEAMTKVGQYASAQIGEHLDVMSVMEGWMAEAIVDLERTNEDAAAMLRDLSGELEGFANEHLTRGYGESTVQVGGRADDSSKKVSWGGAGE